MDQTTKDNDRSPCRARMSDFSSEKSVGAWKWRKEDPMASQEPSPDPPQSPGDKKKRGGGSMKQTPLHLVSIFLDGDPGRRTTKLSS